MLSALSRRVLARFVAASTHYLFDTGQVQRSLHSLNDPSARLDSDRTYGGHNEYRFELVPIARIHVPHVWHKDRIQRVREAIEAGKTLPPVSLTETNGQYHLDDGIHRTNASIERNFSTVPAIVSRWVEAPEARVPVEPEKAQLPVGAWVKLHHPHHEGGLAYEYGYVLEQLSPTREGGGVRRWRYQIGLVRPESEWPEFIDVRDTDFDPRRAPSWGKHLH